MNDFSFNQQVYFNNVLQKPLDFKKSIGYAQNIKAMFSFFSTSKIFFNHLTLKEKESKETFSVIFYQDGRTTTKKLTLINLLIRYDEIKGEFDNILKWWLENEEFISNGLSLYLQVVNLNMASPIQQFLSIVFAIETLHSSFYDEVPFTDLQIKKFKEEKKTFKMDSAFIDRFNDCLSHFNSMSFRDRVKSMIKLNSDLFNEYIDNLEDFINKVKNQRNFYAHKHSTPTASLIKNEHQLYYNMMCKLIFEVTFLSLLGLKKETIKLILKRNYIYEYYKQKKLT